MRDWIHTLVLGLESSYLDQMVLQLTQREQVDIGPFRNASLF
jgi:hypothetical protein